MSAALPTGEETQITCRFVTKLPAEYLVPAATVAVPSNLTRYGLSRAINHLLQLDPPKPFDFLVDGELIRQSLEKFLLSRNISTETVLELEYVFAVEPPKPKEQQPHDDWVSAVAARSDLSLSASYDGVLRCWQGEQERSQRVLHSGPIKALVVLPENQGALALTGGQDHTIQLCHVPALDSDVSEPAKPVAIYREHSDAVGSLAISPQGDHFVSGSWDATLRIWPTGEAVAQAAEENGIGTEEAADTDAAHAKSSKRQKGALGEAMRSAPAEQSSRIHLSGHTQCVASVAWPSESSIVSGSWDHSVRQWDAETGVNVDTFNGNKAVYGIAAAPDGGSVIAFGGSERALHVWDSRAPVRQETNQKQYLSHTDWISAVSWHPSAEHVVATASYDKTLKLWDLRTSVPLHTMQGHTDKVLCVVWAGPNRLLSGGADCTARTFDVMM